jgi:hypothetical protein
MTDRPFPLSGFTIVQLILAVLLFGLAVYQWLR